MGQRENLVIVKQYGYDLYYNHWCANTLPEQLFWGPEHARNFIESQMKIDESGWLDDIWAEGGAVFDESKKRLLFFGGEDELYDIPYRRILLALMRFVWQGWEISWANRGIVDIAGYVGGPKEKVLAKREREEESVQFAPLEDRTWVDMIASIRFQDDELLFFPSYREVWEHLASGPAMIGQIDKSYGYKELDLGEWTTSFPQAGFHLDVGNKNIDIWQAADSPDQIENLRARWTGWELQHHYDRFEVQLEHAHGLLSFPSVNLNQKLQEVTVSILRNSPNPLDNLTSIINNLQDEGKNVEVSPFTQMHTPYEVPANAKQEIIDFAVRSLKKSWGPELDQSSDR